MCSNGLETAFSKVNLNNVEEKCNRWLDQYTSDDAYSDISEVTDISESSLYTSSSENSNVDSDYMLENEDGTIQNMICCKSDNHLSDSIINTKNLRKTDNIMISKSKVHIGDVVIINKPVIVKTRKQDKRPKPETDLAYSKLDVVSRNEWLAQPPTAPREFQDKPAKYVIICHTATEEGFTQAENTLLIRFMQTFHIESRGFADIAYNFLIGSDGRIYEGRNFNVIGAHTKEFNAFSVGIAFIGCFLKHLPPNSALQKAKSLIDYGVERGYIANDYHLVAHRQCRPIESPGMRLYEEIQTWDRWDNSVFGDLHSKISE